MKKIDLGQTIQIVANLGVIGGLVLLAIELGQNNELMAAQARFERLSVQTESATILAENPDLAGFLLKANSGAELDPIEETRLDYYLRRVFTNMEWAYRELPENLLPRERWKTITAEPYRRKFWLDHRSEFSSDFVEYLDKRYFNE